MHDTSASRPSAEVARDEVPADAYPASAHFTRVIASFIILSLIEQLPRRLAEPLAERVIAAIHPSQRSTAG